MPSTEWVSSEHRQQGDDLVKKQKKERGVEKKIRAKREKTNFVEEREKDPGKGELRKKGQHREHGAGVKQQKQGDLWKRGM